MATQIQSLDAAPRSNDDAFNILLLELEFVDLAQKLYSQLSVFTIFPELPTELRLKIWHHTFPNPRRVIIGNSPPPCFRQSKKGWAGKLLPVSMWINVESRSETLKHYIVLDPRLSKLPASRLPPFCFNPTRDLICLKYAEFMSIPFSGSKRNNHLKMLTKHAAPQMLKVHHLQLHNLPFASVRSPAESVQGTFTQTIRQSYRVEDTCAKFLFHFPALQKISIMATYEKDSGRNVTADLVREFVKESKGRFQGSEAPEVVEVYSDPFIAAIKAKFGY